MGIRNFLGWVVALAVFASAPAVAALKIDITQGNVEPLPIAVLDFVSEDGVGMKLAQVVTADLERSGLFRPIERAAFIETQVDVNVRPRFRDWRLVNALALVTGRAIRQNDGRLRVEFRLWDVIAQQQMTGLQFFTTPENWRRISHLVADAIYERLTGETGYFDTRIVFVSESGPKNKRVKRLAIMDQDGHNHKYLTSGLDLVLTPRFSPTTQEIAYLNYFNEEPNVYIQDIRSGRSERLGSFPGMTFAPRFGPQGDKLIMSWAQDGLTDIYEMDLRTQDIRQLTKSSSIDTAPSYSPDGRRVVFESDRAGRQQLYVMDSDGSGVQRISYGEGRYATPVWSPRGDIIAFTKMLRGTFYIGVMNVDGTGERLLADGFLVEGPTWAPNGRVLMYYKQQRFEADGGGGETALYRVDITGFNERRIITPSDASDPAWSPLRR